MAHVITLKQTNKQMTTTAKAFQPGDFDVIRVSGANVHCDVAVLAVNLRHISLAYG